MNGDIYHIGRNQKSNQIFISDISVSSIHAQVLIDEDKNLIIIDLSSKNGIYINNEKISGPTKINKNDVVSIGTYKCSKNDIINAIKKYDFNNKNQETQNVHLKSSLSTNNNFRILSNTKITKKFFIGFLASILLLVIVFFLVKFLNDQIFLKDKFTVSETEETINDSENKLITEKKKKPLKKQKSNISYDYSCFDNRDKDESEEVISVIGEITREIQNDLLADVEISLKDEQDFGDEILESFSDDYDFINSGKDLKKLKSIKNDLVSRILKPRGFSYKIFLVDDTVKNVFTAGGNIYFFKGMYSQLKNDSEIAAIIAHEISHNELSHMTLKLKKIKSVSEYGFFGNLIFSLESFFTESFDQKQEIEADLFGMDLVYPTAYKNCSAVDFWSRNSKDENKTYDFFRSHPFSNNRADCISNHLITNYNINCN
jgi:pSer/pThr/pTyr-binding forkhead associated (FHA) protein